jgi:exodeoxyribonuclease VII large subunit
MDGQLPWDEIGLVPEGVLSVSGLAGAINGLLQEGFARVKVEGEVGKVTHHANGAFYFDVKDDKAVIACVMWADFVARQGWFPKVGDKVLLGGQVTTFRMQSKYQLKVWSMEPAGRGTLLEQLEALRKKLEAEGLFDEERKKPIPFLPMRVGILTSASGAVIHDMATQFRLRCPREVVLYPVLVQGAGAPESIVKGLRWFNAQEGQNRPDVIILARGGGSFEDLLPFSDEKVVRAVAGSAIPVISAIGHEPDTPLCDYAADYRAPTPTKAAEKVSPMREEVLAWLAREGEMLTRTVRGQMQEARQRVDYACRGLPDVDGVLEMAKARVDGLRRRLQGDVLGRMAMARQQVDGLARVLAAHHPDMPLQRGYVMVRDVAGKVVVSAAAAAGDVLLRFKDGEKRATIQP